MKPTLFAALCACAAILTAGCDKSRPETAERIAEAERRAQEALARQIELERQLEDQRLAAERDAIERERMEIEQARAALEQAQSDTASAEAEKLRLREQELARREGEAAAREFELTQQAAEVDERSSSLSERERELAGREVLDNGSPPDEPGRPVADYGMFYDSLSDYGSWIQTPAYGYVWQPVVIRQVVGWRPYTRGRWVCTNYGWTWMSNEPFGWATYHYGRWALLRGIGWVWVPGSVWAPAWVSWRSGGNYIGWAPLPPETLGWRENRWDASVEITFGIGPSWYNFVEYRNFGGPILSHCLPYQRNTVFVQQTTNITHVHLHSGRVINGGPGYDDLSRRIGKPLPFYRLDLDRQGRPGRDVATRAPRIEGGRLRIAAPDVDAAWNDSLRPSRVSKRLENVEIERSQQLRPEITERFRESRRLGREQAERVIAESGGRESFNQRRLEMLQANRRAATERAQRQPRDEQPARPREEPVITDAPAAETPPATVVAPPPAEPGMALGGGRETRPGRPSLSDRAPRPEQPSETQPAAEVSSPVLEPTPPVSPEPTTEPAPAPATETPRTDRGRPRPDAERPPRQTRPADAETTGTEARRQQQEAQQQAEQARREQQQQVEEQASRQQLEEARRQQQEAQRQEEQARREQQQQAEEQARRQQLEEARRQQQEAQRQQMEEARRQQQEAQRQQMEEARRQQQEAQRQQMEEARRQQQEAQRQQMEESRRQQQEAQRQQIEESRRQQE